jgi:hypothetical protein
MRRDGQVFGHPCRRRLRRSAPEAVELTRPAALSPVLSTRVKKACEVPSQDQDWPSAVDWLKA